MEIQERLSLLRELITCNQPVYYWCYDNQQQLLESNCGAESVLDTVFRHTGCLDYAYTAQGDQPLILSNESGLMWIAVKEKRGGELLCMHVIGPCFINEVASTYIERVIRNIKSSSGEWKQRLSDELYKIPTISSIIYCQYAIMLHYCVTGEKLQTSEIQYQSSIEPPSEVGSREDRAAPRDRLHVYQAERMLLRMVREGDMNSAQAQVNAGNVAHVQPYVENPLEQVKIACIIFTSLCTRAAIEGGLTPEQGYSLGDSYIKSIGLAKSPTEVSDLKNQMYKDFIQRVHRRRSNPQYSKVVQSCCDYIEMHVEEKLSIELLADRLGYTKYYLSRCFKKETGCTVNDYIKIAKVERAKLLLANTQDSIADITERLRFCSRSFFTDTFKKITGKPPALYRAENQRI